MSKISNSQEIDSDTDDEDFIPDATDDRSGSEEPSEDEEDDQPLPNKKRKNHHLDSCEWLDEGDHEEAHGKEDEDEERRIRVESIWAEMNASNGFSTIPQPTQPDGQTPSTADVLDEVAASPVPERSAPKMRRSNLLALASKYGLADAAKLTVLEKSRRDWKQHVNEAGDADVLEHHRKDGYLEKVAFLHRTDERQAELVKQMKQSRSGRRH
ncbi:bucentaur or craniofacial development-domain-containing protein [Gaertneriomyces semiglobifer]|nr:bucentaur or craniofacial development-domain-containing protein [Gaertneriomyces semiglobifer]